MIDWYNFIVQHNPTPEGYRTGKGSAYETPLRDKTHGRIYRIVAKDGKPSERPKLSKDDPKGLVAALKNDNMFWRLHAQRLLVERGDASVAARPRAALIDGPVDATGLNAAGVPCHVGVDGLGASTRRTGRGRPRGDDGLAAVMKGLKHPSAAVRRAAVLALPRDPGVASGLWLAGVFEDPEPQVRLAACLAMAEMPANDGGRRSPRRSSRLVLDRRNQQDRWMGDAPTWPPRRRRLDYFKALAQPRASAGRRDGCWSRSRRASPSTTPGAGRWTRSPRSWPCGRAEPGGPRGHHRRVREGLAEATRRRSSTPMPRRPSPGSCRSSRPSPAARCSASPRAGA